MAERMTDEALLSLARNRQEQAFHDLYERYTNGTAIRYSASAADGSVETAEDLVHDCFIGLLRSPRRYVEQRASLKTYLYAAVRNLARKHFRDASALEPAPDEIEDSSCDCLSVLIREETARLVQQTIAVMPFDWREVLILAEYKELTMAEIAAITGAEVNAIKVVACTEHGER